MPLWLQNSGLVNILLTVLQIAEKRREAKGKREKERYIHLNPEFPRRTRGDKKAFLSEQ